MTALLSQNTQANHAVIATYITAHNRLLQQPAIEHVPNPLTLSGRAALDGMVTL